MVNKIKVKNISIKINNKIYKYIILKDNILFLDINKKSLLKNKDNIYIDLLDIIFFEKIIKKDYYVVLSFQNKINSDEIYFQCETSESFNELKNIFEKFEIYLYNKNDINYNLNNKAKEILNNYLYENNEKNEILTKTTEKINQMLISNNFKYNLEDNILEENLLNFNKIDVLYNFIIYKSKKRKYKPLKDNKCFNYNNFNENFLESIPRNYKIILKNNLFYYEIVNLNDNEINNSLDNLKKWIEFLIQKYINEDYLKEVFNKNNKFDLFSKYIENIINEYQKINLDFYLHLKYLKILQKLFILSFNKYYELFLEYKYIDNLNDLEQFILQIIYNEMFTIYQSYYIFINMYTKEIIGFKRQDDHNELLKNLLIDNKKKEKKKINDWVYYILEDNLKNGQNYYILVKEKIINYWTNKIN